VSSLKIAAIRLVAVSIVGLLLCGGVTVLLTRRAFDSAMSDNIALRARREALRKQAFGLVERVAEDAERRCRIARLSGAPCEVAFQRLPQEDAANDEILAWLYEQRATSQMFENEPAASQVAIDGTRTPAPAPVSTLNVHALSAARSGR
jgi:hypothetical protein